MKNYVFGYARVSTEQQNLDRQLDALKKYECDIIFNEKMTSTKKERPELSKMIDRMTEGDTVVIESLSRLGRSTKDLIELTELFQGKGVHLVSLKEAIDTSTSTGKLLFTLMSAIAQFERDVIALAKDCVQPEPEAGQEADRRWMQMRLGKPSSFTTQSNTRLRKSRN